MYTTIDRNPGKNFGSMPCHNHPRPQETTLSCDNIDCEHGHSACHTERIAGAPSDIPSGGLMWLPESNFACTPTYRLCFHLCVWHLGNGTNSPGHRHLAALRRSSFRAKAAVEFSPRCEKGMRFTMVSSTPGSLTVS